MFNRTSFNRTTFNRVGRLSPFEWKALVNGETDATARLKLVKHFDAAVAASSTATASFIRVYLPRSVVGALTASTGSFIRWKIFKSEVFAVAEASGEALSTYGSVTLELKGVNMVSGDMLIIDTEHMTVTLNGQSVVDKITDASAFFKLEPGDNDIIVEGASRADVRILWKDRWL